MAGTALWQVAERLDIFALDDPRAGRFSPRQLARANQAAFRVIKISTIARTNSHANSEFTFRSRP
jgi:hypothetical protein